MMRLARFLCAPSLCAVLFAAPVAAGTAAGGFNVNITLNPPSPGGLCVSSSLSVQTNALVRVVCSTGQFVSIEPLPGRPFVGTHGGAYRFAMGGNGFLPTDLGSKDDPFAGVGTITALRVLNLNPVEDRLELLVSF